MPRAVIMDRSFTRHGFSLTEVLVALVILSVLAAGTLMAFVAAIRISRASGTGQATIFLAQQTAERFRNKIACNQGGPATDTWYGGTATCDPTPPVGPQADPVTGATYEVTQVDCDGDGIPGDCLQIQVTKN